MWSELGTVGVVLAGVAAVGYPILAIFCLVEVPPAVSLMAVGVALGPAGFDVLPVAYQEQGGTLSKAAFVVLLIRAGFGLPPRTLRAVIGPALAFGIVPAAIELCAVAGLGRAFLFSGWDLALLAGFLVAAVSPAVILPTMLDQKDAALGGPRFVPDRILAQTVVNAFVAQTGILFVLEAVAPDPEGPGALSLLARLPLALVGEILLGVAAGAALRLELLLGRGPDSRPSPWAVRSSVALTLAVAFAAYFGCSLFRVGVFSTLAIGVVLRRRLSWCEPELRKAFRAVWGFAEIVLFVNLGLRIELSKLTDAPLILQLLAIMAAALVLRLLITHVLTRMTALTPGEGRYVTMAQIPKATIQAVFGALPLVTFQALRPDLIPHGHTLLIMAVLAIVATAPVGAVLLERFGRRLLVRDDAPG